MPDCGKLVLADEGSVLLADFAGLGDGVACDVGLVGVELGVALVVVFGREELHKGLKAGDDGARELFRGIKGCDLGGGCLLFGFAGVENG